LPRKLFVLATSPEAPKELHTKKSKNLLSPDLKGAYLTTPWTLRDPKPASPVRNGRALVCCGFLRSVHSPAQRTIPRVRPTPGITPTNHYRLDKIGFVPQIPAHPSPSCASRNSGQKPSPGKSRNLSRCTASSFFQASQSALVANPRLLSGAIPPLDGSASQPGFSALRAQSCTNSKWPRLPIPRTTHTKDSCLLEFGFVS